MNFSYTPEQQAFRAEVRAWLEAHVPRRRLASFDTREGFEQHRAWEQELFEARLSMVIWPKSLGGRDGDLVEWLIFEEEYWRADAPLRVNQNGQFLLGPTLMRFGTEVQKQRFLPRIASSQDVWAQAWSENGAGSDLAAIRAKAVRHGDHFIINGQKIWSSRALFADWIFGIFRSDPLADRHHGLSYILVPLSARGISVRPIKDLNGRDSFAEIFFDEVKVSVDNLIGVEGQGWELAMATAGFERSLLLRSPGRYQRTAEKLVQLYRRHRDSADRDPLLREAVLQAWMDAEAYNLAAYHTVGRMQQGDEAGAEASANKIFWSELDLHMHETALRILGERGELLPEAAAAGDVDNWLEGFLFAQAGTLYAGTNEIQRNIIAERMLGLPKA
jgi:alkylation response protein AidB-like acyl-CoA dehydrogenase